jgi:hypothetical protein
MLDLILNLVLSQINNLVGFDISNYKEYLTIPAVGSLFAFYFIYRGIKFVLKIIFYIFLAAILLLVATHYLGFI